MKFGEWFFAEPSNRPRSDYVSGCRGGPREPMGSREGNLGRGNE